MRFLFYLGWFPCFIFLHSTYSQQSDPKSDNTGQFVESDCYLKILTYNLDENVLYVKIEN